jgi:hypothetical protein
MPAKSIFAIASAASMGSLLAAKREMSARYLRPAASFVASAAVRRTPAAISPRPDRNVVGIGIGEKVSEGKPTGQPAVKFFVRTKFPESQLLNADRLPKTVGGLPVDVEESGLFRALAKRRPRLAPSAGGGAAATTTAPPQPNPRTRIRPAQPGCSVGFEVPGGQFIMAGTFGALVKDANGVYILSNNHVLADEGRIPAGAPIYQPGLLDNGNTATDRIAALSRFAPLTNGKIDAALALADDRSLVSNEVLFIGKPTGAADAAIDMVVHKFGRTTSYTAGRVTSVNTDVTVQYETGNFFFEEQIIIVGLSGTQFSAAGDSGSLILERATNTAVGLLFAGSSSHTIANHLPVVLQTMGVTLV